MPLRPGFSRSAWSSSVATGMASVAAASTMYLHRHQLRVRPWGPDAINSHYGVDIPTVPLPHWTKARLATQIPASLTVSRVSDIR